jgi:hypothetical protein
LDTYPFTKYGVYPLCQECHNLYSKYMNDEYVSISHEEDVYIHAAIYVGDLTYAEKELVLLTYRCTFGFGEVEYFARPPAIVTEVEEELIQILHDRGQIDFSRRTDRCLFYVHKYGLRPLLSRHVPACG